jgi:hypothetical protein
MHHYHAFGGILAAPFPFPELREVPGAPAATWTLSNPPGPPPERSLEAIGEDALEAGAKVTLSRYDGGLRVEFTDSGTFDLLDQGSTLHWYPLPDSNPELARLDMLGRVLAVALHLQDRLSLHASAVAFGGRAIGFVAAKGSGKSTLALAMLHRGAQLLTDDTLPIDVTRAIAYPGVHSVRVWGDSAERFGELGPSSIGLANKHTMAELDEGRLRYEAVPLEALYALSPRAAEEDTPAEAARRTSLGALSGTFMYMRHSKLGALLGGSESRIVFDRCSQLATVVPCYELDVVRDFDALPTVAQMLMDWHSP